jgi:hypothetical protein
VENTRWNLRQNHSLRVFFHLSPVCLYLISTHSLSHQLPLLVLLIASFVTPVSVMSVEEVTLHLNKLFKKKIGSESYRETIRTKVKFIRNRWKLFSFRVWSVSLISANIKVAISGPKALDIKTCSFNQNAGLNQYKNQQTNQIYSVRACGKQN